MHGCTKTIGCQVWLLVYCFIAVLFISAVVNQTKKIISVGCRCLTRCGYMMINYALDMDQNSLPFVIPEVPFTLFYVGSDDNLWSDEIAYPTNRKKVKLY